MNELDEARQAKEALGRANLAEQVKNNPIYQEAFMMFKAQCMEQFTSTRYKDSEERDEIWRKMQTIEYIQDYLNEIMDTGKLAQETLTALERVKKTIGL